MSQGTVEAKNGEYAVWDIENNGKIHINKGSYSSARITILAPEIGSTKVKSG